MNRILSLILALIALAGVTASASDDLARLRDGEAIALLRHATAPGVGDPQNFVLDDCATQRNLDATGRQEARAWGEKLRAAGIAQARIYTSRWCRCRETAALLRLGPATPLASLDSFFANREAAGAQGVALRDHLAGLAEGLPVILVTHQVNITELTGLVPAAGEMILVTRHPPHRVIGRLR